MVPVDAGETSAVDGVEAETASNPGQQFADQTEDLRDALGSVPQIARVSAAQAHHAGVAIEDAMTGNSSGRQNLMVLAGKNSWGARKRSLLGVAAAADQPAETQPVPAPGNGELAARVQRAGELITRVKEAIGVAIVGQGAMIDAMIDAIITDGHIMLLGVPGVAKTYTVLSMARAIDAEFSRIQFTPDLQPGDITGTDYLDQKAGEWKTKKGPIFANLVLADEINRTPPKTQAAMLSAMQEREVVIGGKVEKLPDPFLVMATRNPLEQDGTFPLPEAQMDRFLYEIVVLQPHASDRYSINDRKLQAAIAKVPKVATLQEFMDLKKLYLEIEMDESLRWYAQALLEATATPERVGVGREGLVAESMYTRASEWMERASRVQAMREGRTYVIPEDVQAVFIKIMGHRLILDPSALDFSESDILEAILTNVPTQGWSWEKIQEVFPDITTSRSQQLLQMYKDDQAAQNRDKWSKRFGWFRGLGGITKLLLIIGIPVALLFAVGHFWPELWTYIADGMSGFGDLLKQGGDGLNSWSGEGTEAAADAAASVPADAAAAASDGAAATADAAQGAADGAKVPAPAPTPKAGP